MTRCPNCGDFVSDGGHACTGSPHKIEGWENPIADYFKTMREILLRPSRFFRAMPLSGGIAGPLAYALITHWTGAVLEFFWRAALGGLVMGYVKDFFQIFGDVADVDRMGRGAMLVEARDRLIHWFWGAGSIVADPFLTLAAIMFTSFFVFIGARILVAPHRSGHPDDITFESAVRIICYGMTPAILAGLPLVGGAIASFWVVIVTIIAAREAYRIKNGRAVAVALFPKLLFLGIIFSGIFLFAVFFLKLIASNF